LYRLKFVGCRDHYYVTQYYDRQSTLAKANRVNVKAGATTDIDARLILAGHLTGQVTNEASPPGPLAGICVTATFEGGGGVGELQLRHADRIAPAFSTFSTKTNTHGEYAFDDIPGGSYTVSFSDCRRHAYLPTSSLFETVVPGATTANANETMVKPGRISGTVTSTSPGGPLSAVCVDVETQGGIFAGYADSGRTGTYTVKNLLPGSYVVEFLDCVRHSYLPQFYDGQTTMAAANLVSITSSTTTANINATMALGGRISGRVTSTAGGGPVAGINVNALACSPTFVCGPPYGNAITNAKGGYTIKGLAADNYLIDFNSTEVPAWSSQYYYRQTNIDAATLVPADPPSTTTRINGYLTPQ
jgi:hypothetical protein